MKVGRVRYYTLLTHIHGNIKDGAALGLEPGPLASNFGITKSLPTKPTLLKFLNKNIYFSRTLS